MPSLESIAKDPRFIGQTVQSVLKAISKAYDDHIFVDFTPGKLNAAAFLFEGDGWIYFHIDEFQHQPAFHPERKWDLDLLLKEKVAQMEFEAE
jgi:hypothetical protein